MQLIASDCLCVQCEIVKCQMPSQLAKPTVIFIEQSVLISVQLNISFSSTAHSKYVFNAHSMVSCIFHTRLGNVNRSIHLEDHPYCDGGILFTEHDLVGVFCYGDRRPVQLG